MPPKTTKSMKKFVIIFVLGFIKISVDAFAQVTIDINENMGIKTIVPT